MRSQFVLLASTFAIFMVAAGAPSPLYAVFQHQWGFSATMLTAIFAVYALSLLVTLLIAGSLSDYIGRRPIILSAIVFEAIAMTILALAQNAGWLITARVIQGIATGLATSALSASLIDTEPDDKPGLGHLANAVVPLASLGIGALGAASLVLYLPWPTHLVFWILCLACLFVAVGVARMAETVEPKPGWRRALVPVILIPGEARSTFVAVAPCLIAGWALSGLYMSLGPSVANQLTHGHHHLLGGLVILGLTGAGATSSAFFRRRPNNHLIMAGTVMSAAGLGFTVFSVTTSNASIFLLGTIIAGIGFGPAFTGSFRSIMEKSPADKRAGLASAVYVISYIAFGAPVIIAGIATTKAGLHKTVLTYTVLAIVLYLLTLILSSVQLRSSRITDQD